MMGSRTHRTYMALVWRRAVRVAAWGAASAGCVCLHADLTARLPRRARYALNPPVCVPGKRGKRRRDKENENWG